MEFKGHHNGLYAGWDIREVPTFAIEWALHHHPMIDDEYDAHKIEFNKRSTEESIRIYHAANARIYRESIQED